MAVPLGACRSRLRSTFGLRTEQSEGHFGQADSEIYPHTHQNGYPGHIRVN